METNSLLLMLVTMGVILLIVYVILPRFIKNYSAEKVIKLILLYGLMGYLCFDFYLKEKYLYIVFFTVGLAVFTYLIIQSKRKED